MIEQVIIIPDAASTMEAARKFIPLLGNSRILAFHGDMGVGKTTFIKSICKELGVESVVTSPTFALVNEYTNRMGNPIYHFDFYRVESIRELRDMGCEEYLDSGNLCLIEWPEKAEGYLPDEALHVFIEELPGGARTVRWTRDERAD
jgi:tRNA threonylcarbamoyladenosine biosynthesis protein TsaE